MFADDNTTRSFFETAGDATVQTAADIGAAVTVTDPDNDTLTYTLEDASGKFTIVSTSGQIQTKVGESYNYEATTSYAVTVKVDDSKGGVDTIAVTINVANVVEFDNAFVNQSGFLIYLRFVDNLSTTLPPISAIAITVDGEAATVEFVSPGDTDTDVQIKMASKIRQGQAVTASYTDPTTGNDTNAIQDVDGNDAPSFTDEPVDNQSTLTPYRPRPPTGLTATARRVNPNRPVLDRSGRQWRESHRRLQDPVLPRRAPDGLKCDLERCGRQHEQFRHVLHRDWPVSWNDPLLPCPGDQL